MSTDYETQNGLPDHTIMKGIVQPGATGPWAKYERGEIDTEEYEKCLSKAVEKSVSETNLSVSNNLNKLCMRITTYFAQWH